MGIVELDQHLEIQDDLTPLRGQWVAVRNGRVVASDPDLARLLENSLVEPSDRLVAVGAPGTTLNLL